MVRTCTRFRRVSHSIHASARIFSLGSSKTCIFGHSATLDGMIERMEAELGYPCTVIATGGLAKVIIPHCKRRMIEDQGLLLKGLKVIYDRQCKGDMVC